MICGKLSLDASGTRIPSVEDVSQLHETLKVSPGRGLLSDGQVTICVGKSDVSRGGKVHNLSSREGSSPESETDSYYPSPPVPIW
jgi:hypothetical protein